MKTLRKLTRDEVTFKLTVKQDDLPVRGNAMASGDDVSDKECEDEILRRLDQGDVWAWAFVTVTASWKGHSASECLGAFSYADEDDFKHNSFYYEVMVDGALNALNEDLMQACVELQELETEL